MNNNQTIVKMVLDRWYALQKTVDGIFDSLTDEQLQKEVAPGRNRAIYLLGHLTAVHDDMFILLDLGNKLYPELNEPFIKSPDRAIAEIPPASQLRSNWKKLNETLNQKIGKLQPDEWFQRHTAVSAEDFAKEPHRNKLNIMITRATHLAYHNGQLALIK